MDSVRHDVQFAIRQLRRHPSFATTVILTLALGIGANTAIFSVIQGTLLEPLPYPVPDRLVYLTSRLQHTDISATHVSALDFGDIAQSVDGVSVAGIDETVVLPLTTADRSQNVVISRTTWNFFDVLGVGPQIGRTFSAADGVPVAQSDWRPLPLIISDGMWRTWFGGTQDVLGRAVKINGLPARVIGVMPPDLVVHLPAVSNIGSDIDVWWPLRTDFTTGSRDTHWLRVIGRVGLNTAVAEVQAELDVLAERLMLEEPYNGQVGTRFDLTVLREGVVGPVRDTLVVFLGAVGFVLLISCANVTNLLLARGTGRGTELAVRHALGAGRFRIIRQIFTESAILSLAGAIAGIVLAFVGVSVLKTLGPVDLPRIADSGIDARVLGFTLGVTSIATVLYGLVPAIQHAGIEGSRAVQTRTATAGSRQRRVQTALAATEVALSIILLTGATLMIRTFREMQRVPLGFDTERLVTLRTNVLTACPWRDNQFQCIRREIEERLERSISEIPGVLSAGIVFPLPFNGVYDRIAEYTPDVMRGDENAKREAYFRTASPDYFRTMGIDVLTGRTLLASDNDSDMPIVVVDAAMVEREWPGQNPIGQRIAVFGWGFDRPEPYEVVGVVEHVPQLGHRDRRPTMYLPRESYRSVEVSFAVRVNSDAPNLTSAITEAIAVVSPDLPVEFVQMRDLVSSSLAPTRFVLTLLTVFSGMALVLAAVGLYGVLAFGVRSRTREIGIRMAFGAGAVNVVRDVLRRGALIAGVGTLAGLTGAIFLGRVLERHLFEVSATDPVALASTGAIVLFTALLASYVPARRASRVDPMIALRTE